MAIINTLFRHSFRLDGKELDANLDHINSLVPYLNVKEFGAKGDGSTDDRVPIQTAIDSLTNGGTVFFPMATYRIGTPGLGIGSNVTLLGDGATLKATNDFTDPYGNGAVLQNYTPPYASVGNTNVRVEGLKIHGNELATRCIIFQGGSRLYVSRCHTLYPWVSGAHIDVRDFEYGIIDDNYIEGNAYALGINCLGSARYVQITNNRINNTLDSFVSIGSGGALFVSKWIVVSDNVMITTNAYGVDLFGVAEEIVIANNIIHDCNLGAIQGNLSGSLYPKNIIVIGNIITGGSTDAISLNCATDAMIQIVGNQIRDNTGSALVSQGKELIFSDNILENGAGIGIEVTLVNRAVIKGNLVRGGISHGIMVTNADGYVISDNYLEGGTLTGILCEGLKNSVISNNVVKNFGQASNATYKHGIQIRDGTTVTASIDNIVIGNRIYDDQTPKTQDTGIVAQQASDYNVYEGNNTRGNKTADASVVGTHNSIAGGQKTI